MRTVRDFFDREVRLTDERLAHILDRQEMQNMGDEIIRTLQAPAEVRVSRGDPNVRLFMSSTLAPKSETNGCALW